MMAYLLNSIPLLEMMFAEIQYSFRTGQSATVDCSNHVLPRVCFENLTVPIQHQLHNNLFSAQTLSIMMQPRVSWLSSPVILLVEKRSIPDAATFSSRSGSSRRGKHVSPPFSQLFGQIKKVPFERSMWGTCESPALYLTYVASRVVQDPC